MIPVGSKVIETVIHGLYCAAIASVGGLRSDVEDYGRFGHERLASAEGGPRT